ncbi:MAG: UDP-N-acetylglucosamine 1-carboxyvinyltransferase [Deltaproteobacteria bacterium]|nr:UDP-N-acetylglucosamine 1-carboxyvinyltransferase [Deltaproteobacteria bacterium]
MPAQRRDAVEKFVIEGGSTIGGTLVPMGSKNEALPAIAATLLACEPVTLRNVPEIRDVHVMFQVLEALGAEVSHPEPNVYVVDTGNVEDWRLPAELCRRIRASILFAGAMLGRKGRVELPPPGGDVIGRRRLDTHFDGFTQLGARLTTGDTYELEAQKLKGADLCLDEASVTATENLLMVAARARGETLIRNAACEPHVQGLARLLGAMGATVDGIGTNLLRVRGAQELGGADYTIGTDYLEVGSFIALAAVTGGELRIERARREDLRVILSYFRRLGIRTWWEAEDLLVVPGDQDLKVKYDLHGSIPKIDDAPWPQFPTDMMSVAIVAATQAQGTVLFFEKMFEGRMFFVDNLISMGAQIILCDPHRVVVVGPSQLYGTTLESPDVRAGMALLTAALCAEGRSQIFNVRQIDRGYERIDERLRALGANIQRVELSEEVR